MKRVLALIALPALLAGKSPRVHCSATRPTTSGSFLEPLKIDGLRSARSTRTFSDTRPDRCGDGFLEGRVAPSESEMPTDRLFQVVFPPAADAATARRTRSCLSFVRVCKPNSPFSRARCACATKGTSSTAIDASIRMRTTRQRAATRGCPDQPTEGNPIQPGAREQGLKRKPTT